MSLKNHTIPSIWKTSEIVPVPKKTKISEMNDLRPVALTSVIMKCLEKLVLSLLLPSVVQHQDPFQFAYKCKRSVDDAIALFVNNIYHHIDVPKKFCRVMFIDFSSAFNTIQPKLLVSKLLNMSGVNKHIVAWIFEFLIERPQFVRININGCQYLSSSRVLNTGAPQGTCISPALFTIYTDDCRSDLENVNFIKFADDSVIQGLLGHPTDLKLYKESIEHFVQWCKDHCLQLNIKKTKEMIFDFRRKREDHEQILIDGEAVEVVHTYKYLGVTIDDKLNWQAHASSLLSKCHQRMYFIRKLKYFNIDNTLITLFYKSILQSVISFCLTVWGGNARLWEKKKIDQCIKTVSKITKGNLDKIEQIFEKECQRKFQRIMNDPSHPFFSLIEYSHRSGRVILMKTKTERYRKSFLPTAVRLHRNSSY